MARKQHSVFNFDANDVWAAACAAQRINGNYVKFIPVGEKGDTNRQIVDLFLGQTDLIQQCDRDQAEKVRTYFKGLTFKILKGIKLNDFENNAMVISNRDTIQANYDIAVICSLPSTYERTAVRDQVNQRINFATGGCIGVPGNKIRLEQCEVLKCNYSQQYNTYFVTCITKEDQIVYFAHRAFLDLGKFVTVEAKVKAHKENSTQLNYAKVFI